VLNPIPYTPVVIGVGLNYRKHAVEAGVSCFDDREFGMHVD
jgi:hypothetical protein